VLVVLGKQLARQAHGAQHVGLEALAQAFEFVLDEAVVETHVVGDEQLAVQACPQLLGNLGESGRAGHHVVADAGEMLDERGNGALWIHQGAPARGFAVHHFDQADFGDAVDDRIGAGGFQVDEDEPGRERRFGVHPFAA